MEMFTFPSWWQIQRGSDVSGVQWALGDLAQDRGSEFL
jgi:hypothetical protein